MNLCRRATCSLRLAVDLSMLAPHNRQLNTVGARACLQQGPQIYTRLHPVQADYVCWQELCWPTKHCAQFRAMTELS